MHVGGRSGLEPAGRRMHVICMTKKATANKLGALSLALTDATADGSGELSPSAVAAVLTLRQHAALGTTELAGVVGLSQPACTRMVDKLVADGLVVRRPAEGRVVPIALTDEGRRLGELMQARRLGVLRDVVEVLDKKERKDFDRLLDKLLAAAVRDPAHARRICRLCDRRACGDGACPSPMPEVAEPGGL